MSKDIVVEWRVVTERGVYSVEVGTFSNHEAAMKFAEEYEKKNKVPTFVIPVSK